MNVINIEQISKVYGEKTVFDHASFGIQQGDKIGIVGINGTGKSTLLKIVAKEEEPDEGQVVCQNGLRIAWLPQNPVFPPEDTVSEYIRGETQWKAESYLSRLGINEYDAKLEHLSGGQRRKTALAKVLARDFDVLLLDEPTNHLDQQMIGWLEEYLREQKCTLLMVTHDRYFLDRVTNKILEISHGSMYSYEGNYSHFLEMKAQREEMELASQRKRQSILRMEQEWAMRGCRARSTKQRARLERLEQLKNQKGPLTDQTVELSSIETRMGKKTIELKSVSKSYGEKKILEDFSYIFLRNQKVGIIGPNGCGKSTLLKMIAGLIKPDLGEVDVGETIRIGYFAQEEQHMDDRQRVIDYVRDIGEYVMTSEGRISASSMLERFLFTPDMQYAPIGKLSGGEKRRLYLLGVLCGNINVLLLDEAGNNLDIPTLTILEDYLNSFVGIVAAVSHDRYFLDNVADRILELDGRGHIRQYEGGYSDYLEAKKREETETEEKQPHGEKSSGGKSWKQNRPAKLKFTYREQKEFETIDDDIAALEKQIAELDDQILANATNSARLNELTIQKEETEKKLDEKMGRWVYLNDLAERIEKEKDEKEK
ncbi:MAG: ABC-F family ATP-binding cassette domain-containing protein [Ruminococcus sp.]